MLRKKKKKSDEVRWLITFADLITLLFCFFVYLSLFSKPSVSLETQFKITDGVLRILREVMPANVIASIQSLKDQFRCTTECQRFVYPRHGPLF